MEGLCYWWWSTRVLPQTREELETNSQKQDPTEPRAQGCDRCGRTNCSCAMVRLAVCDTGVCASKERCVCMDVCRRLVVMGRGVGVGVVEVVPPRWAARSKEQPAVECGSRFDGACIRNEARVRGGWSEGWEVVAVFVEYPVRLDDVLSIACLTSSAAMPPVCVLPSPLKPLQMQMQLQTVDSVEIVDRWPDHGGERDVVAPAPLP
jgi:hypothetical protein